MTEKLPESVLSEELIVTVRAVRLNGKQMTVAVFKQLPIVELCTESGNALSPIQPWGIVRQEIKETSAWLLLEYEGVLCKAPLDTERLHQSEIEAGINLARSSLEGPHSIPSINEPKLKRYEWLNKFEDARVAIHREALKYQQLYISI